METFYRDYWQRQPLLIRRGLPDVAAPLEANELAGLACEDALNSRLITGTWEARDFAVEYGPIDEERFAGIGDRDWTLLVQDVDKWAPAAADLLSRFDFLPAWRVDDLMVSFAATGGSVGPHTDEYDVFLVQLEGRRRWQIARDFDPRCRSDCEIKVLQSFQAEEEWVCAPGDILYLPPNVAHYGVALEPCLTASVGLRAPSVVDLLDDLAAEWDGLERPLRYSDAGMKAGQDPYEVDPDAVQRARELLQTALAGPRNDFAGWFARAVSRYRLAEQLLDEPPVDLEHRLAHLSHVYRQPAARLNWVRQGSQALLCANGQSLRTSIDLAQLICRSKTVDCRAINDESLIHFLLTSGAYTLEA